MPTLVVGVTVADSMATQASPGHSARTGYGLRLDCSTRRVDPRRRPPNNYPASTNWNDELKQTGICYAWTE
jgi:hypothetical protein